MVGTTWFKQSLPSSMHAVLERKFIVFGGTGVHLHDISTDTTSIHKNTHVHVRARISILSNSSFSYIVSLKVTKESQQSTPL